MDRRSFLAAGSLLACRPAYAATNRGTDAGRLGTKSPTGELVNITEYGAKGDGVTDCIPALQRAMATGRGVYFPAGTYYLSDHFRPPDGSALLWLGENQYSVTIKCAANKVAVLYDSSFEENRASTGVYIEGITFDGDYRWDEGKVVGMRTAVSAFARRESTAIDCIIKSCRFLNMHAGCLWLSDFSGQVAVTNCFVKNTKSINVLYSEDVNVSSNVLENVQDNAIAVSRGAKKVVVHGNSISECSINGIFLGAVTLRLSGSVSISGDTEPGGNTILQSSTHRFTWSDVGKTFVLRTRSGKAFVTAGRLLSPNRIQCRNLSRIPGGLVGSSTDDWSQGPESAATSFIVSQNIVDGSGGNGILLGHAPTNGIVSGNIVKRAGIFARSTVEATGSIYESENRLRTRSSKSFAAGDWIIVKPTYTSQDELVSQVTEVAADSLSLSSRAPGTLLDEKVYKAELDKGRAGIVVFGWDEDEARWKRSARNLLIIHNVIVNPLSIGMKLGSEESGAVSAVTVTHNRIVFEPDFPSEARRFGILMTNYLGDAVDRKTGDGGVFNNQISMGGSGVAIKSN